MNKKAGGGSGGHHRSNSKDSQGNSGSKDDDLQSLLAGSPPTEQGKYKKLQDQIEIAEEELTLLRRNRGDQLQAHGESRRLIQSQMVKEKNRLKYLSESVKNKREDLGQALQDSKVNEIENRIKELEKERFEIDRKLGMLEGLKSKQVRAIERQQ